MNFETAIIYLGKIYKFLEKVNSRSILKLDSLIDMYYPQVASRLQTYSRFEKFSFCATNGKKSLTNLFNQILNTDNRTTVTNVYKNAKRYPVLASIVSDLSKGFEIFGKSCLKDHYSMAMEADELSHYFNVMKFDYLLLNNLFVDQNDFYTLQEKRKQIQEAIILNSNLNLIINADEPMFYKIDTIKNDPSIAKKRNKIFYGFERLEIAENGVDISQKNDILRCPLCSCKLDYKKRFYSHLGKYNCSCGFKRPELDIVGNAKIFNNYSFLNVVYNNNKYVFKLPFGGVYNAYNALGAIALALYLKIDRKTITKAFENYSPIDCRDEIINYKNKKIKLKIIKNPTSLSEALAEIYGQKNLKVVFCLNDDIIDGIDTSWIWDSNFNAFKNFENKIYISGQRFDDMALKLKYSGVNPCLLIMDSNIKNSINCCYWELEKNETMLILSSPSLGKKIKNILKKN